jgi:hypothetical protein
MSNKAEKKKGMEAWVRQRVQALALDEDVYVEYVKGILEDEDMELDERVESAISILSSACEGEIEEALQTKLLDEQIFLKEVDAVLNQEQKEIQKLEDLKRIEQEMKELEIREKEKKEAEEAMEKEKEKALARSNMSREELMQREKIISAYGFSALSEFDEDGNLIKVTDTVRFDSLSFERQRIVWGN